ncbi:MAG TPA: two-component system response regulator [Stellaceae bacterium]|jgi:putative two-component system response regulator|nr:two-component system response regulator [Stellaceae bacterium]
MIVQPSNVSAPPTILVVDDTAENLVLLSQALGDQYRVKAAKDGASALQIATSNPPDLILLDIVMPDYDGFEICRRLKSNPITAGIPVIFMTARTDSETEQRGFELGAVDYLSKPISPPVVRARVTNHLQLKASADFLKSQNQFLEQEILRRTQEVRAIQDVAVLAVASLAETRDNETGNHIRRTQHYVRTLAGHLVDHPRFRAELDENALDLLFKSAPLHDIGKVGIPDRILLKPGRLDPQEFEIMKTHTTLGFESILQAEQRTGSSIDFLRYAKEIALSHQEKWDGSGYPEARSGIDIPLSARLMAVADVYDALISRRIYKPPFSQEKSIAIMREGRAAHFDPDILDAFLAHTDDFQRIAENFADDDEIIAAEAAKHSVALGDEVT